MTNGVNDYEELGLIVNPGVKYEQCEISNKRMQDSVYSEFTVTQETTSRVKNPEL